MLLFQQRHVTSSDDLDAEEATCSTPDTDDTRETADDKDFPTDSSVATRVHNHVYLQIAASIISTNVMHHS